MFSSVFTALLDKIAQKLTENDPTVFQNDIQLEPFTLKSRLVTSLATTSVRYQDETPNRSSCEVYRTLRHKPEPCFTATVFFLKITDYWDFSPRA